MAGGKNDHWFSSAEEKWETPQSFFDLLHARYAFTLDAAADDSNAKVDRYFTPADNALAQSWEGVVWLNPPYGSGMVEWVRKAWEESQKGAVVVCLLPARTDTGWWHVYAMRAAEIYLVRGRLRFGGASSNAPFPSAVVVFRPGHRGVPTFRTMSRHPTALELELIGL